MKPPTRTRRNFPAIVFGVLTACLIGLGVMFATGCQNGYWDRADQQAIEKANTRIAALESALTTANAQKDKLDAALAVAQKLVDVATANGAKSDELAKAKEVLLTIEKNKSEVYQTVATLQSTVTAAKTELAKMPAGTASAAERDAATGSAILNGLGGLGGPIGVALAGIVGTVWQGIVAAKSKKETAQAKAERDAAAAEASGGADAIRALEAAKKSANGGENTINFNDPATIAILDTMGKSGKAFVDKVQRG